MTARRSGIADGYWRCPRWLPAELEDGNLTPTEFALAAYLGARGADRFGASVTNEALASTLNVNARTVSRLLVSLRAKGLFDFELRPGQRRPFRITAGPRLRDDGKYEVPHLARKAMMPPRRPALLPAGSVVLPPDFWEHLATGEGTILGFEEVAVLVVVAASLENAGALGPHSRVVPGEDDTPALVLHADFGFGARLDPDEPPLARRSRSRDGAHRASTRSSLPRRWRSRCVPRPTRSGRRRRSRGSARSSATCRRGSRSRWLTRSSAMLANSAQHIAGIAETTRGELVQVLARALKDGLSIGTTSELIRSVMSADARKRATTIARTEIQRIANGSAVAGMRVVANATGSKYLKRWLTAPGAESPRHDLVANLDGQTVGLDESFDVNGFAADHPGDAKLPPEEAIACRCTVTFEAAVEG